MTPDPILDAFGRLVRRDPRAPLLVSPSRQASRGDVDAFSWSATAKLPDLLPPGVLAGLVAPNGPGFLAGFLALRRAGLAVLLLDAATPEAEARHTAEALGAIGILRCAAGWPSGPRNFAWESLAVEEWPADLPGVAVVKLSSGSTGAPRGIATPAEALVADDAALAATMGISPGDRLLATVPMSHSYGFSSLALPALTRATVLALPEEAGVFDPLETARRTGATVFATVPAVVGALARMAEPEPPPASLRLVITAGAPLSAEASARFRESFGLPVHVFYGASECGGICYDRLGGAAERGTVGSPVEGVRVTLEPPEEAWEDEREPEREDAGIVTVESPAVAAGYLPRGEAGSPSSLGGGRFRTSDLAAWKDGELVLGGRLDDLINVNGKKVSPRELERVLRGIEGVEEVVVLGLRVPGREGEMLRAVIACEPGRLGAEDVLSWCRARLAPHKVPRSVVLIPEIPRTPRGKLDRAALAGPNPGDGPGDGAGDHAPGSADGA